MKCFEFAALHIQHFEPDVSANFCLHTVQLLPQKSCKYLEYCKMFKLKANEFQGHFVVEVRLTLKLFKNRVYLILCLI